MSKEFWKAGNMVYPLPAVLISCQRENEKPNIFTVAWTGTICTNPAMVYISVRPERHSYAIIEETKEFVINLTTESMTKAVDFCGVRSGKTVDKFKETGLTAIPAQTVSAPLVAQSPVNIECRLEKIIPLGSHHMFIAKVLGVNVDKKYINENGKFELAKSKLVAYSHGEYYALGHMIGNFGYSVRKNQGKKLKSEQKISGKKKSTKKKKPTQKKSTRKKTNL